MRHACTAVIVLFSSATLQAAGPEPEPARRDHGPGTSGGGLHTLSAETIKEGDSALGIKFDFARFESLTKTEIESMTRKVSGDHAHLDTVDWTLLRGHG